MKVNQALMAAARFERKPVSELTVAEFRKLMQECFDVDRITMQEREAKDRAFKHYLRNGFSHAEASARAADWKTW